MYQIVKIKGKEREILDWNMSLVEANTQLEEYHAMVKCIINRVVSPIVSLRATTELYAFVVDDGNDHYIIHVEEMFN